MRIGFFCALLPERSAGKSNRHPGAKRREVIWSSEMTIELPYAAGEFKSKIRSPKSP